MITSELSRYLGYNEYERSTNANARSKYGKIPRSVSQNKEVTFKPKIVSKRMEDIKKI